MDSPGGFKKSKYQSCWIIIHCKKVGNKFWKMSTILHSLTGFFLEEKTLNIVIGCIKIKTEFLMILWIWSALISINFDPNMINHILEFPSLSYCLFSFFYILSCFWKSLFNKYLQEIIMFIETSCMNACYTTKLVCFVGHPLLRLLHQEFVLFFRRTYVRTYVYHLYQELSKNYL